jgi:hypothetical protein
MGGLKGTASLLVASLLVASLLTFGFRPRFTGVSITGDGCSTLDSTAMFLASR